MTLGEKIKYYRDGAGLSQLALGTEVGLHSGHLSRIETGKIKPKKETIILIAKALNLKPREIAFLFGIESYNNDHLFKETTDILTAHNLQEVLDRTVNNLVFKLGYLASCIFLIEGDNVYFRALTNSNLAEKAIACLNKPVDKLTISLTKDTSNLTVKAIKENKVYFTHHTHEYIVPAVTKQIADKIQQVTGDKSNIIFPLSTDGEPFGAIVYVQKIESDFRDERDTLEIISRQIAVAIQNARKSEALTKDYNAGR